MRIKNLKIPIYGGTLVIVFDKDLTWVQKTYKTALLENYGAVTLKDETKERFYVVAFESRDRGLIAHEIVHIINYIFLDCGIQLDRVNDESQAYLTGWLFDEIDKFINQYRL